MTLESSGLEGTNHLDGSKCADEVKVGRSVGVLGRERQQDSKHTHKNVCLRNSK